MDKLTEGQMQEANKVWCGLVYDGQVIPLTDKVREIFQTVANYLQFHPCGHKRIKEYPCFYSALEVTAGKEYPTSIYFCEDCGVGIPKPVDPRREKIAFYLSQRTSFPYADADAIIAMLDLDEVK